MRRVPTLPVLATAAVVGVVQLMGSVGASEGQPDRRGLDAVAVLLLLVAPLALLVRDRWPHAAAVVAFTASAAFLARGHAYGPVFLGPMVALFTAGLTPWRRRTWLAGAYGAGAFTVAVAVDPRGPEGVPWGHLAVLVGWLVAVLAVAEVARIRRDQAAERARVLAEEERRRAGEQRLRIAQDLHDVLAHDISLINVQAGVALHLVDEQPEQARTALANIKDASRDALHELRSALEVLRTGDAPRTPAPALDGLPALVEGVRASGLDVTLDGPGPHPALPTAVELAGYRIVQEALTNVTRHAGATRCTVVVRAGADLRIEVTDDGRGGVPGPGNGITGMRERATSLGGVLEAGPAPDGGFRVRATIPT